MAKIQFAYVPAPRGFLGVLTPSELCIWLSIAAHAYGNDLGDIRISLRQVSKESGVSYGAVRHGMRTLQRSGLVVKGKSLPGHISCWSLNTDIEPLVLTTARKVENERASGVKDVGS